MDSSILNNLKISQARWLYYVLAMIFIVLICRTSWPGFMSFDSLDALHEARTGVHWNINCPIMLIWIQSICDLIYPGAALLFVLQVGVTLIALADILVISEIPCIIGIPFMILFVCCPIILGPILVVWKDVGMMAFFMAAISCLFRAQKFANDRYPWVCLSIGFTFLASSFRLNAILAALPIYFAISQILSPEKAKKRTIYLLTLVFSTALIIWFINSYKFKPNITPVDPYPAAFFQAFDILGISALAGENLLPKEMYAKYDKFTIEDLRADYFPQNSNKAFVQTVPTQKSLIWPQPTINMTPIWQHAILAHPYEYLRHRSKVFKALLAIHMAEPYYLTHPGIDANEFGIVFSPTKLGNFVLNYLSKVSTSIFAHPWFYYILAGLLLLVICFYPSLRSDNILTLLLSSLLNIAPMFFLVASAESRFNLWSVAVIMLAFILILNNLFKQLLIFWRNHSFDQ